MLPLLIALAFAPNAPSQEPAGGPAAVGEAQQEVLERLRAPALRQQGRTWSARQVVDKLAEADTSLWEAFEGNPEYVRLYLASPRFYDQVRWFSTLLLLDAADVPSVEPDALRAEAAAWAADHGRDAREAEGVLALHPFEIEARARLIALQPDEFEENVLRRHFHSSVPEFFGRIQASWIALPLFDMKDGAALGETERHARYALLDEVATRVRDGGLEWEDAVRTYDEDPRNDDEDGSIGWVRRDEVQRFDADLLRQVFAGLGFTQPEGVLLRGPVFGSRWVYLVRIEAVVTSGVVDMQRVRGRVIRSLRESLLQDRLYRLGQDVERSVLLPPAR